jgi:hypothetical protein
MEHKLKNLKRWLPFKETSVSVAEANPILESKNTAINHARIKCLQSFL